jgi:myosin heavy chain 6/7
LDELQRSLHETDGSKRKLAVENCDLVHQFEEAERAAAQLSNDLTSLTTQVEDSKRLADAETRERINLLGKIRNMQHELNVMKEHLDEEYEAKQVVERQLSKAFSDIQLLKTRYETEGVARAD